MFVKDRKSFSDYVFVYVGYMMNKYGQESLLLKQFHKFLLIVELLPDVIWTYTYYMWASKYRTTWGQVMQTLLDIELNQAPEWSNDCTVAE